MSRNFMSRIFSGLCLLHYPRDATRSTYGRPVPVSQADVLPKRLDMTELGFGKEASRDLSYSVL